MNGHLITMRAAMRSVAALALCLVGAAGTAQVPVPAPAPPAASAPFVIGTHQPTTTFQGRWVRRIHIEAFRRLEVPVEVAIYPLQRLTVLLDLGQIDGDTARVHGYQAAHPEAVRVEESIFDVHFGLYTTDPAIRVSSLSELDGKPWRAGYLRGVAICENRLKQHVPAQQLLPVNNEAQAFSMLLTGRLEIYCGSEYGVLDLTFTPQFKGLKPLLVVQLGESMPLHPYLHRRWSHLAPRLAAVLRQMKSEGVIERFRVESLKEASAGS